MTEDPIQVTTMPLPDSISGYENPSSDSKNLFKRISNELADR